MVREHNCHSLNSTHISYLILISKGIGTASFSLLTQESEGKWVNEESEQGKRDGSHCRVRLAADCTLFPQNSPPRRPFTGSSKLNEVRKKCGFISLWKIKFYSLVSWISGRTTGKKKSCFSCLEPHQPTLESLVGMIKRNLLVPTSCELAERIPQSSSVQSH